LYWEDQTSLHGKTVGLPVAMMTLLILNGKITTLSTTSIREVYLPILKLEEYGVVFKSNALLTMV
jgi:hypothetical protein